MTHNNSAQVSQQPSNPALERLGVFVGEWRDFAGFSRRFNGMFSDDNNVITARWEQSGDGSNWEYDFDLTYTRVR